MAEVGWQEIFKLFCPTNDVTITGTEKKVTNNNGNNIETNIPFIKTFNKQGIFSKIMNDISAKLCENISISGLDLKDLDDTGISIKNSVDNGVLAIKDARTRNFASYSNSRQENAQEDMIKKIDMVNCKGIVEIINGYLTMLNKITINDSIDKSIEVNIGEIEDYVTTFTVPDVGGKP